MLLDDEEATLLVTEAAEHLSTADLPKEIGDAIGLGALTALLKKKGSIRNIVTGGHSAEESHAPWHNSVQIFEEACSLSVRALHASGDWPRCSSGQVVDGVGPAEDSVVHRRHRDIRPSNGSRCWRPLHINPALTPLLPFVRTFYGKDSTYVWYDDEGAPTRSFRARGASKGTTLMPVLYALGQYAALTQVDASLHEEEMLFTFLDDIYILCDPSRVGEIFLQVKQSLVKFAGVQVNLGKTKVWNRAAIRPEDLDTVGAEAWRGEGPEEERGLVVLVVPVGHKAFVQKWLADKEDPISSFSPEYQRSRTRSVRGCSS